MMKNDDGISPDEKEVGTTKGMHRGMKAYGDYIVFLQNQNRFLIIAFMLSLMFLGASVFGWYKTINLPRTAPLVIEVNQEGIPTYRGKIDTLTYGNYEPKEYQKKAHITRFLRATKEIYLDKEVMISNLNEAVFWVSQDIRERLRDEVIASGMFQRVGKERITIEVETMIPIPGANNSYQVDWYENRAYLDGKGMGKTKYRTLITLVIKEPESMQAMENNPLGLYIIDYSTQQVITRVAE